MLTDTDFCFVHRSNYVPLDQIDGRADQHVLAAPGSSVLSTQPGDGWARYTGRFASTRWLIKFQALLQVQ